MTLALGTMDSHPDVAHDCGAAAAEEEQPWGEEERLGQQVREEDQLQPGLHQRVAQDGRRAGAEASVPGQALAQWSRDSRTGL